MVYACYYCEADGCYHLLCSSPLSPSQIRECKRLEKKIEELEAKIYGLDIPMQGV